jgi:hypothetical protein
MRSNAQLAELIRVIFNCLPSKIQKCGWTLEESPYKLFRNRPILHVSVDPILKSHMVKTCSKQNVTSTRAII